MSDYDNLWIMIIINCCTMNEAIEKLLFYRPIECLKLPHVLRMWFLSQTAGGIKRFWEILGLKREPA